MATLNLGILAHVDAGKTTLTERLLYAAGAIDKIGSVDEGTTQTDYLALERERGITIRSAVASFVIGDLAVNLIDTPGHPDFIAEVERVLSVLDGAVLVVSAVEGVQPQTPLLMRALQRVRVPTLIFVNKIDRAGASEARVMEAIARRLTPAIVPLTRPRGLGTREANVTPASTQDPDFVAALTEVLAERDEAVLAAYVDGTSALPSSRLLVLLADQTARAVVHPMFFGSAMTGAGVNELTSGLAELLPSAGGDPEGPVSARVFKIERTESGEKVAYVRMFSGSLRTRDRVRYGQGVEGKVTALAVFGTGNGDQGASVTAGGIAKVWGLSAVQVGDDIGDQPSDRPRRYFAPPTLEAVVVPKAESDSTRLRTALAQLSEQDPLINVRQDDTRHETSVSLYGDVQKEVIQATLARDYGIEVDFRDTTTICIERPVASGEAMEVLFARSKTNITGKSSPYSTNPFRATLGLRVDPAPAGSGVEFRLNVDVRLVPLYIYKTTDLFAHFMEEYIHATLEEGLSGWQVTDCTVTLYDCGYGAPATGAGDFRKLTPLVLMRALEQAGIQVCEPMSRVTLEVPAHALSGVLSVLARLGAAVHSPASRGDLYRIDAVLPVALVREVRRQLPGLTSGEGVLEAEFAGYQPVTGPPPTRPRTTPNPLNREEYLMHMNRRV